MLEVIKFNKWDQNRESNLLAKCAIIKYCKKVAVNLPTTSLWGPLSTEFQFHDTFDLQFVQPS